MDHKQQIDYDLLQEIHQAKLENVLARFLECTRDSHGLNSSIVLGIVSELVNILIHFQFGYEEPQVPLHLPSHVTYQLRALIEHLVDLVIGVGVGGTVDLDLAAAFGLLVGED